MQNKAESPQDTATNIPLPIALNPELPPVIPVGQKNYKKTADWHHPMHPRRTLEGMGVAGQALRDSRLQWVMFDDHHEKHGDNLGYHYYFDGPKLPTDELDWFKTVIFMSANYVPDKAVSIRQGLAPKIVNLSRNDREKMLSGGMLRVASYDSIKQYLLGFLADNGLSPEDDNLIDQFTDLADDNKKLAIGKTLIEHASLVTTEPYSELYNAAKLERLLPTRRSAKIANFVTNILTLMPDNSGEPDKDTILSLGAHLKAA